MALTILFEARTDVGLERSDNQDHYGSLRQENAEFFVVCDGMGGHAGGSTASRLGVQAIEDTLREAEGTVPERIENAIHVANDAIHSMADERRELRGMGTTVVLLAVDVPAQTAYVAHVGDSRIYRLRGQTFERMTRDHTMVQRLVDEGIITEEEAENHPQSNVISRSLGGRPQVEVEHGPEPLDMQDGDIYLLCSDGLCGLVSEPDMAATLAHLPPAESAERLIEQANDAGGYDNITAEVVLFGTQPPPFDPAALHIVHPEKIRSTLDASDEEDESSTPEPGAAEDSAPYAHELPVEVAADDRAKIAQAPEHDQTDADSGATDTAPAATEQLKKGAAAGAPVLEDQSTGKLFMILTGLIVFLILLVFGLVLRTSPNKKDDSTVVVPEQNDDASQKEEVYKAFKDEAPEAPEPVDNSGDSTDTAKENEPAKSGHGNDDSPKAQHKAPPAPAAKKPAKEPSSAKPGTDNSAPSPDAQKQPAGVGDTAGQEKKPTGNTADTDNEPARNGTDAGTNSAPAGDDAQPAAPSPSAPAKGKDAPADSDAANGDDTP